MTEKNVLIFQGGWDGHEPVKVAARFAKLMEKNGYTCKIYDNQEVLLDLDLLMRQDLIIPCWTMGKIDAAARANIVKAVAAGHRDLPDATVGCAMRSVRMWNGNL